MTDLILCGAIIKQKDLIDKCIKSVADHKFEKKYILFDGPPSGKYQSEYDDYKEYKARIKEEYPEFEIIEEDENLYYKPLLEKFIRNNLEKLSENLFIIQDDVEVDPFNLEEVLKIKEDKEDCKILYIGEKRKRAPHWFSVIDDSDEKLTKVHGWAERVYLVTKTDFISIMDYLDKSFGKKRGGCGGKFIDVYYYNMKQRKSWKQITEEEKLEYWKEWGTYDLKDVFHRHLVAKR